MNLCSHYACRCARANELAIMAGRTGNNGLLEQAVAVHRWNQQVPCRQDVAVNRGIDDTEK